MQPQRAPLTGQSHGRRLHAGKGAACELCDLGGVGGVRLQPHAVGHGAGRHPRSSLGRGRACGADGLGAGPQDVAEAPEVGAAEEEGGAAVGEEGEGAGEGEGGAVGPPVVPHHQLQGHAGLDAAEATLHCGVG